MKLSTLKNNLFDTPDSVKDIVAEFNEPEKYLAITVALRTQNCIVEQIIQELEATAQEHDKLATDPDSPVTRKHATIAKVYRNLI